MFTSLVDLITQSIFLGISPGVKEGLGAFSRGDRKDLTAYKAYLQAVLRIRDPVPFSGMGKKSGSGSGMNNPDHISESLENNFLV